MKTLLGYFACFFVVGAQADNLKYPNADSLSYWNRATETKDALVVLRKQLADAEGYLVSQKYMVEKKKLLHAKKAATEQELRDSQWLADDLTFKIAEIKEEIVEAELFEKLYLLRYQLAKEEKVETVASIASTYTAQWKGRALLNDIRVARYRAELAHRQWIFETMHRLHAKKVVSEETFLNAKDLRDEVIGRINMATERADLARKAEQESLQTEGLVR